MFAMSGVHLGNFLSTWDLVAVHLAFFVVVLASVFCNFDSAGLQLGRVLLPARMPYILHALSFISTRAWFTVALAGLHFARVLSTFGFDVLHLAPAIFNFGVGMVYF